MSETLGKKVFISLLVASLGTSLGIILTKNLFFLVLFVFLSIVFLGIFLLRGKKEPILTEKISIAMGLLFVFLLFIAFMKKTITGGN